MFNPSEIIIRRMSPATIARVFSRVPLSALRYIAMKRFRQTVRWAGKHSAFYRRAFAERKINARAVRTPEDLGDFYTMSEDIIASSKDFICQKPSIVFESSGTSGKNKQIYYTEREMREHGLITAIGYFLMGLDRTDRVANAFDFSIWIPGMICHYGLMAAGIFSLAFGKVDPMEVYRRLGEYGFTAVFGEPTWLIRLTEIAEQMGPYPLKMLLGGAEEMPPDAIEWMERVWAPAKVRMSYGSVELGGGLGFQPCDQRDGYHIDIATFLPEVIEPDENGYGEIVFTTLCHKTMPLIRYRTRDVAKMYGEKCPCGISLPRMSRLRGRRDEIVVASGGNLYPQMFENIIRPLTDPNCDWQVVFKLEGIREVMEVHVESVQQDRQAAESELRKQMSRQYPDLMKNLGLGIFEMRVLLYRPGSLRKGRKLKRIVDKRYVPQPETE